MIYRNICDTKTLELLQSAGNEAGYLGNLQRVF